MQRPDTPDGLFLDGNPNTGVKGTPITAEWLNALIAVGAFLSGDTEPPAAELGGPNDYYLCKTSHKMYGPKDQETGWPGGYTSIIGPQGEIGATGETGNPYKAYATLALANADLANIPADGLVWVNADATAANIGYWAKTGGVLVQSSYDRVAAVELVAEDALTRVNSVEANIQGFFFAGSGEAYRTLKSILGDSKGLAFDLSLPGTAFQDVGGTLPAVVNGDRVSSLKVISGDTAETLLFESLDLTTWSAPSGASVTATSLTENSALANHLVQKVFSPATGSHSLTTVVKPNGRTKLRVSLSSSAYADFDLVALTMFASFGADFISGSIVAVDSGFVQIEILGNNLGAAQLILMNSSGSISYTGDGVSGILFRSMQWLRPNSDLIQGTATKRPTYIIDSNGRPCLRFDGISQTLGSIYDLTGCDKISFSMSFVSRKTSTCTLLELYTTGGGPSQGPGFGVYANNGASNVIGAGFGTGNTDYLFNNIPAVAGNIQTISVIYDPSGSTKDDQVRIRLNGLDIDETQIASLGTVGVAAISQLFSMSLGSRGGTSAFSDLDIYSFLAVGRALSEDELSSLERSVSVRAGVTLESTPISPSGTSEIFPVLFNENAVSLDKTLYRLTSPFASLDVQTEATSINVSVYNNLYASYPTFVQIGVYINGVYNQTITPTASGATTHNINLPAGNKLVSFVNGLQSTAGGASVLGTFVTKISSESTLSQVSIPPVMRFLAYGDSIAVGGNALDPTRYGWVMQVRQAAFPNSVALEGWGYRALYDDANTPELLKAFVKRLTNYGPATIWLAIGTNDYGLNKWSAASFGSVYANLLDLIHTYMPLVKIYCQTPLIRGSEAANSFGDTPGAYRAQISDAFSTRGAFCALIDGTAILTTGDLADGVHPSTAGHTKYAESVITTLGW